MLYNYALKAGIKVVFNHRLTNVDMDTKELTFTVKNAMEGGEDSKQVVVSGADARILACDGVNSVLRDAMEVHSNDFKVKTYPWGKEFKVHLTMLISPLLIRYIIPMMYIYNISM